MIKELKPIANIICYKQIFFYFFSRIYINKFSIRVTHQKSREREEYFFAMCDTYQIKESFFMRHLKIKIKV